MKSRISGGRIVLGDKIISNQYIYWEDGVLTAITDADLSVDHEIHAHGQYVAPGFIDIHVHGGGGADFLDGTPEAFVTAATMHAQHGSTTIIPTATSGSWADTQALAAVWQQACSCNTRGADMPGLHLEGPYFAMSQRGAQDPRHLQLPDPAAYLPLLEQCGSSILRWSAAPELPGALELGRELRSRGILAAIGHSDADCAQVKAAWNAGFTHVTHLYSGMSSVHRRNAYRYAGVVEAAYLIDDMTVEIIADGKHLPSELLQFVYKFKGPDRTALITDAMRGAGMPDGPSILGHWRDGLPVIIEEGVAKLPDRQSFAGSTATTDLLIRNMIQLADIPLTDAIKMATATPANIMGLHDRGLLKPGLRADLVLFDEDIHVTQTIIRGQSVFSSLSEGRCSHE